MQRQNQLKFLEYITNKRTKRGDKLTDNTIKSYTNQYNTLLKSFKTDKVNFVNNPDNVFKVLEKEFSNIGTLKLKINVIILILDVFYSDSKNYTENKKIYTDYLTNIWNLIKEQEATAEPTEKQVNRSLTKEENDLIISTLLKKVKYSIKTPEDLEILKQLIIYLIYNTFKMRGDLAVSRFILNTDKEFNNMVDNTNYIVIDKVKKEVYYYQVNYKTKNTYKDNKIKLNDEIYKYILKLFNYYTKMKIKKKWFLYQKDLKNPKPFNQDNFSKFYLNIGKETIGKITSLQINRTQDASENINEIEIIKNKSKNQNHSVNTHIRTYAKKGLPSKN
jgi:hypothetical protein